jgi:hypothetical protein
LVFGVVSLSRLFLDPSARLMSRGAPFEQRPRAFGDHGGFGGGLGFGHPGGSEEFRVVNRRRRPAICLREISHDPGVPRLAVRALRALPRGLGEQSAEVLRHPALLIGGRPHCPWPLPPTWVSWMARMSSPIRDQFPEHLGAAPATKPGLRLAAAGTDGDGAVTPSAIQGPTAAWAVPLSSVPARVEREGGTSEGLAISRLLHQPECATATP